MLREKLCYGFLMSFFPDLTSGFPSGDRSRIGSKPLGKIAARQTETTTDHFNPFGSGLW